MYSSTLTIALAAEPEAATWLSPVPRLPLLFDEPPSSLDEESRGTLEAEGRETLIVTAMATIVVFHGGGRENAMSSRIVAVTVG